MSKPAAFNRAWSHLIRTHADEVEHFRKMVVDPFTGKPRMLCGIKLKGQDLQGVIEISSQVD